MEQFNRIIPNGAERIISMVEREQSHRIQHEETALASAASDFRRGHWIAASLSALSIVASLISIYLDAHPTVSVAFVGLPIGVIIQSILRRQ